MTARLMSLLIWAAVAASGVYWGLRLFTQPTPLPAGATVATEPVPAAGSLVRLLGEPPARPAADEAPPPIADSRFRLLGVVAPRGAAGSGLALISVDGKPPRAVAVGRELEPGLRLLAVSHRQAELGAALGAPVMTLALPLLAEAQRGRPGDIAPPPGLPGVAPGAAPVFNRAPGALPLGAMGMLQPGLPRPAGGLPRQALLPGLPIQPQGELQDPPGNGQPDGNGLPTR